MYVVWTWACLSFYVCMLENLTTDFCTIISSITHCRYYTVQHMWCVALVLFCGRWQNKTSEKRKHCKMNESDENKCETKRDLGMNSYIVLDSTNLTRKIQENLSKLNSLKLTSHQKTCNWNQVQRKRQSCLSSAPEWMTTDTLVI